MSGLTPGTLLHKGKRTRKKKAIARKNRSQRRASPPYLVAVKWRRIWVSRPGHRWWPEVYVRFW